MNLIKNSYKKISQEVQKIIQRINKKMSFEPKQIQMICLEDLVLKNHIYHKFLNGTVA